MFILSNHLQDLHNIGYWPITFKDLAIWAEMQVSPEQYWDILLRSTPETLNGCILKMGQLVVVVGRHYCLCAIYDNLGRCTFHLNQD